MRLTKQSEIAMGILTLCARAAPGASVTTRSVAATCGTTKDHAAQIVAKLVRAGYLASERGRAGGIRLARPAPGINVGEVLRLVDPVIGNAREENALVASPAFNALRRAAWETYLDTFDGFTIADLVAHPAGSRIGCLDCDLTRLARRGQMLSRLHDHVACGSTGEKAA